MTIFPENADIDNLQVLGVVRGQGEKDAFKNFVREYDYLPAAGFDEIIALELANEKQYSFSLKNDTNAMKK
jgi:hypothetical protein